jgi:hypothetical protein
MANRHKREAGEKEDLEHEVKKNREKTRLGSKKEVRQAQSPRMKGKVDTGLDFVIIRTDRYCGSPLDSNLADLLSLNTVISRSHGS